MIAVTINDNNKIQLSLQHYAFDIILCISTSCKFTLITFSVAGEFAGMLNFCSYLFEDL